MEAAYIKVLGMATKAISRSKHVFIFKTGFRMSFHFQNVVLLRNVFSFQSVKGSVSVFFFFPKTVVNKYLSTKICTVTTNSLTDVVNKQQNIYKTLKFVSVVKNL